MAGRALVLGAGGVTGVSWELGVLAGLAECGVDLTEADLIVGTSAGSIVAVQITSGTPLAELHAAQLVPADGMARGRVGARLLLRWARAAALSRDPLQARARLGRVALAVGTPPEAERRAVIAARLRSHAWPGRPRLLITAVDAGSGEFAAFDAASGVGLVDAVSASCAVPGVWPPVTIGGRRWMDGGARSAANADLAAGYGRVVVLAPITGGFGPMPGVAAQAARLRRHAAVAVVSPDLAARRAIGHNVLDPARRAAAARTGRGQGLSAAPRIAAVWTGAADGAAS